MNFSANDRFAVARHLDGSLGVFALPSGRLVWKLALDPEEPAGPFAIEHNGRYLAINGEPMRIWDLRTTRNSGPVVALADIDTGQFTPDGKHFLGHRSGVIDFSSHVLLWNVVARRLVADIVHDDVVWKVVTSPRDPIFVTLSGGAARIWSVATGTEIKRLDHQRVTSAVFSPNGAYLSTGGDDGTLRVWNASTLREEVRLVRDSAATAIGFSPDGRFLLSGVYAAGNGPLYPRIDLWRPEDLIRDACRRVTRNFTIAEWGRDIEGEPRRETCTSRDVANDDAKSGTETRALPAPR